MRFPNPPDTIEKKGTMKFPDGKTLHFVVEDEVKHVSTLFPYFCLYIQELRFRENNAVELRFGYYIIGKKGPRKGKWVWGQFCPSAPVSDYRAILKKAQSKGLL